MKERILTFIIGFLVGAIIATSGFLIYSKTVIDNFKQPEMMQMNENEQMGQPLKSMEEPPQKPSEDNGEETPKKLEEVDNITSN